MSPDVRAPLATPRDAPHCTRLAPYMPDELTDQSQSGKPSNGGGEPTLSPLAVFVVLALIALTCVGGYFLLMKLIDVSRQEDCFLAGRRNCASIEAPSR